MIRGTDILNNLIANLVWALILVPVAGLLVRVRVVQVIVARLAPMLGGKVPHIDFALVYTTARRASVVIENASTEPAYNVYVYVLSKQASTGFTMRSLGNEGVRKGILAPAKSSTFKDKEALFASSSVADYEIWVEFSNGNDVHFRTIVLPQGPRGEAWRVLPPRQIRNRLPMVPYLHYQANSDSDLRAIRRGKKSIAV